MKLRKVYLSLKSIDILNEGQLNDAVLQNLTNFFSYLDRDNSAQSNILSIIFSAILIIMFIDDLLLITIQT